MSRKRDTTGLPSVDPTEARLADVPDVIAERGRVAGFEHLRDKILRGFEAFINLGINPYAVLKLVIETDRHALFAELQAEKVKNEDNIRWNEYQGYLKGEVDVAPMPAGSDEDEPVQRARHEIYNPHGDLVAVRNDYEEDDDGESE